VAVDAPAAAPCEECRRRAPRRRRRAADPWCRRLTGRWLGGSPCPGIRRGGDRRGAPAGRWAGSEAGQGRSPRLAAGACSTLWNRVQRRRLYGSLEGYLLIELPALSGIGSGKNRHGAARQGATTRRAAFLLARGSARPPGCAPGSVPLPDGSIPDGLAGLRTDPNRPRAAVCRGTARCPSFPELRAVFLRDRPRLRAGAAARSASARSVSGSSVAPSRRTRAWRASQGPAAIWPRRRAGSAP
jgi:hypothetical protein